MKVVKATLGVLVTSDSTNPILELCRQEEQIWTNKSKNTKWIRTLWSQPFHHHNKDLSPGVVGFL